MLTYNVHGLPPGVTGDDTEARMRAISPKLNAYDVAALQENFFFSDLLMEAVDRPWIHHFHEVLPQRLTHSGLTLTSVPRLVDARGESWETCHGLLDGASDCLGSKGYQWARLALHESPDAELDVYNLHAEAGGGDEDDAARSAQVDQLLAAIEQQSAGRAIVVVGDTNMHPDEPQDAELLRRLREEAGLTDACDAASCGEPDHIDRFLSRSADNLTLRAVHWARATEFEDAEGQPLSDHPALLTQFAWETR